MNRAPGGSRSVGRAIRLVGVGLFAALAVAVPLGSTIVAAAGSADVCYVLAKSGGSGGSGWLSRLDLSTGVSDPVGAGTTGNPHRSVAVTPGGGPVYTTEAGRFGRIDTATGGFVQIGTTMGVAAGPAGPVALNDIHGLGFDPGSGHLYATQHRPAPDPDVLVRLDPATGTLVPGVFGGDDYVQLQPPPAAPGSAMIRDLAFDPDGGALLMIASDDGGSGRFLVSVDPATGSAAALGALAVNIEGLGFAGSGLLVGTTGDTSTYYEIDPATAAVSNSLALTVGTQHEGIDCVVPLNADPVFDTDLTDRSDAAGTSIALPASATDPDGDGLTYGATGLLPGLSIDAGTGLITGRIGFLAAGTYEVEVTVTDDGIPAGSALDTFTWTVTPVERLFAVSANGGSGGGSDLLTVIDPADPNAASNEVAVGTGTGTGAIRASALYPGTDTLYAVDRDTFGTIDPVHGVFTASGGPLGAGDGSVGPVTFDDVTALDVDPVTGNLLAVQRRNGGGDADLLFAVDPATGVRVPDAFGAGHDYVAIAAMGSFDDVDAIAVHADGTMFVTITDGGNNALAVIALTPGPVLTATGRGALADGIEGLAFDAGGRLWGTSVGGGSDALYEIDPATGAFVVSIPLDDGDDYGTVTAPLPPLSSNAPPVFDTVLGDRSDAEGASVSFAAPATDPDGDGITWSATGLPSGVSIDAPTGAVSGAPAYDAAGIHGVRITATDDGVPARSSHQDFTWTVTDVNRPPLLSPIGSRSDSEGASVSVPVEAVDPDGDSLTYSAAGLPSGIAIDPATGTMSGTLGYDASGTHLVEVKVGDDGIPVGSALHSFTWTVVDVNRHPVVTGPGPMSSVEGGAVSIGLVGVDPDGDALTFAATGLPAGLSIDPTTGLISGTIAAGAATGSPYGVVVSVTDDGSPPLAGDVSFTWTVAPGNSPPVLLVPGTAAVSEGETLVVPIPVSDPDGDAVVLSVADGPDEVPSGMVITPTGELHWTPGEEHGPGVVAVTIEAVDAKGSGASVILSITVSEINEPPTVAPIGPVSASEGSVFTLSVLAADGDLPSQTLAFTAAGLPVGLAIDPATGVITGTPVFGTAGTHAVTITVDDGSPSGGRTEASFALSVAPTNRGPDAADDEIAADAPIVIDVLGNDADPDGDPLVVTGVGVPLHGSVATDGTTVTYTSPPGFVGEDEFVYTVSDGRGGTATARVTVTVTEPPGDPADDPVHDPVHEPADDPVDDPADEPVDDPADDPVDEPVDEPVDDPVDDPADEPVDEPVDDPVDDGPIAVLVDPPTPPPVSPPQAAPGLDLSGVPESYVEKDGFVLTDSRMSSSYVPPDPDTVTRRSLSPREGLMVAFRTTVETLRDQVLPAVVLGVLMAWLLVLGVGRREDEDPGPGRSRSGRRRLT